MKIKFKKPIVVEGDFRSIECENFLDYAFAMLEIESPRTVLTLPNGTNYLLTRLINERKVQAIDAFRACFHKDGAVYADGIGKVVRFPYPTEMLALLGLPECELYEPVPHEVCAYIDKVIVDACKAENRPNDVRYACRILNGALLFAIKTQYIRVRRRVEYRMLNNLNKNFGLSFSQVLPDAVHLSDAYQKTAAFFVTEINPVVGINPHNSIGVWELFGKRYAICPYRFSLIWSGSDPDNAPLQYLETLRDCGGYDWTTDNFSNDVWESFLKAFVTVYHMTPMDYYLEQVC